MAWRAQQWLQRAPGWERDARHVGLRGTRRQELPVMRVRVKVRRCWPEERCSGRFLLPCPSPVFLNDDDSGEDCAAIDDDGHLTAIT